MFLFLMNLLIRESVDNMGNSHRMMIFNSSCLYVRMELALAESICDVGVAMVIPGGEEMQRQSVAAAAATGEKAAQAGLSRRRSSSNGYDAIAAQTAAETTTSQQ